MNLLAGKRVILIDLDDTLWDTWGNNKESLKELYTALLWGQYFSSFESFFEEYYYPINYELWSRYNKEEITKEELSQDRLRLPLLRRADGSGLIDSFVRIDTVDYWIKANDYFMERIRAKTRLCPYAEELLSYLSARYEVCILSNGFREVQYTKLERSGLSSYVKHVILSDEVGYNKPNPKIFEHALSLVNATAEDTVMIGDSWASDIVGGEQAGIDTIWYNPYNLAIPMEVHPTKLIAVVTHLSEVEAIL